MSAIESTLQEHRIFTPPTELAAKATISGMDAYRALTAEAEKDYEGYWARLAREELSWHKPFTKVLDESRAPFYTWFEDGELNASYNCIDRHGHQGQLSGSLPPGLPLRQRAEGTWREEGRPRSDLYVDVDRRRGRHAGVCAHRRHAFGRIRRLLVQIAAGARGRCGRRGRDHR